MKHIEGTGGLDMTMFTQHAEVLLLKAFKETIEFGRLRQKKVVEMEEHAMARNGARWQHTWITCLSPRSCSSGLVEAPESVL